MWTKELGEADRARLNLIKKGLATALLEMADMFARTEDEDLKAWVQTAGGDLIELHEEVRWKLGLPNTDPF